jgi:hypothetical protein
MVGLIILVTALAPLASIQHAHAEGNGPMEIEEGDTLLLREQYWKARRGELTAADVRAARDYANKMPVQQLPPALNKGGGNVNRNIPNPPSGTWSLIGPNPISNGGGEL